MGGTFVSLPDNSYGCGNQALFSKINTISIATSYQNSFLTKELSTGNFSIVFPTKFIHVGVHTKFFGFSNYNEWNTGISFSKMFAKKIMIGIEIDFLSVDAPINEKRPFAIIPQMGFLFNPYKNLFIGFHAYNFSFSKLNNNLLIAPSFNFGISNKFNKKFILAGQINKTIKEKISGNIGLEYVLQKHFFVRTGIGFFPIINTFGTGFEWDNFKIDLAIQYHYQLATINSSIGIKYSFGK